MNIYVVLPVEPNQSYNDRPIINFIELIKGATDLRRGRVGGVDERQGGVEAGGARVQRQRRVQLARHRGHREAERDGGCVGGCARLKVAGGNAYPASVQNSSRHQLYQTDRHYKPGNAENFLFKKLRAPPSSIGLASLTRPSRRRKVSPAAGRGAATSSSRSSSSPSSSSTTRSWSWSTSR